MVTLSASLFGKAPFPPTFQKSHQSTLKREVVCFAAIFIIGCQGSEGCLFVWLPLLRAFCESLLRPTQNIPFLLSPTPTPLAKLHLWEDRCEGLLGEHSW